MTCAYIIADVTVTNAEQMVKYREWSTKAMQEFGVEVLVRGGTTEVLEGDWSPTRLVVLKLPSLTHAQDFYNSATYTQARKMREGAGVMRMVVVEGI